MRVKNRFGYSLVELMVSIGIWGTLISTIGIGLNSIFTNQKNINNQIESVQFMNSLLSYMQTEAFCTNELVGSSFPIGGARALPIVNYKGFGTQNSSALTAGTFITNNLRISDISLMHNTNIPTQTVQISGNTLNVYVARIEISVDSKVNQNFTTLKPRFIEFPILVRGTSIEKCDTQPSPDDICEAFGNVWDSTQGKCIPSQQCNFKGSYTEVNCTGGRRASDCLPAMPNPITNAFSCPAASSSFRTYFSDTTTRMSCGKKCSYNVRNIVSTYICTECK